MFTYLQEVWHVFRDDSVPYQVKLKPFYLWMYLHVYSLPINLCKGNEEPSASPLLRRSVACQTHRAQRSKKIGWDFT